MMLSGLLAQTQPKPQSAHDTITRLCDRLLHSNFLEDRRAAILGLKGFSRKYRETVAAGGLKGLILALQRDSDDIETCRATLETLLLLFIKNESNEDRIDEEQRTKNKRYQSPLLNQHGTKDDFIALWLTDEFTQNDEMVFSVIEFVKLSDFYIKLYSLQLLSALITNRPSRTQECILAAPLGISVLVSAMDDVRDAIRNESILVLLNLVEDHADVQKLVAFEGAFDKLFNVIELEGGLSDGIVVHDSLKLMALLLHYNVSNQNHFRETNCVQRLSDLLVLPVDKDGIPEYSWDDQLQKNLHLVLEICRHFVPPGHWATAVNQEALCKHGVLLNILRLAFGPSTTIPIRSAALYTAADLVRVNQVLQSQLLAIDVPYVDLSIAISVQKQPQIIPVASALLNWALLTTSIHVFELRLGAQHCLSAVFEGNHDAKLNFINEQIAAFKGESSLPEDRSEGSSTSETLIPPSSDNANLISALVDYDPDALLNPYKSWFAAVILMRIFEDALDIRDQVAFVKIGDESLGEEVVSSIRAMSSIMVTSLKYADPRISVAYLMLLSFWLYEDLNAVNEFLEESSTVQSLIWLITRSGSNNSLVVSLAAILLGISYDFSSKDSPFPRYVKRR
jgi:intracellular protein transport protein USO1